VPGRPLYDWRELHRWGIDEQRLPAGSEIRFRQSTLWEQYRWQISLVAALILLQTGLIAGLFYEHWRLRTAEKSARDSLAELAHVNRLATAGELATSIVHEVAQPLMAIVAHAEAGLRWLGGATPRIDEARAALRDIVKAGHHAAGVVHNIRAFVKKTAPQNSSVEMNELIRGVLSLEGADLRKRDIRVLTELADGLPPVLGDDVHLKQVLMNLISNAVNAMTTVPDRPHVLRVASDRDPGGDVLVQVEDSGPGIPPQNLERIFTAFHTTKPQGMGMGLSISRSIIEAHHGRLWASNGSLGGAVFNLALPVASSRGPVEQGGRSTAPPADAAADRVEPAAVK